MKPKFVHDQIRDHILSSCGAIDPIPMAPLSELEKTEWSKKFEQLMRNRLIIGAFRYGKLKATDKTKYNRIDSIRQRLDLYDLTGNQEHLVDIANLCLLEFEEPNHPGVHFAAQDDKIHTKEL